MPAYWTKFTFPMREAVGGRLCPKALRGDASFGREKHVGADSREPISRQRKKDGEMGSSIVLRRISARRVADEAKPERHSPPAD